MKLVVYEELIFEKFCRDTNDAKFVAVCVDISANAGFRVGQWTQCSVGMTLYSGYDFVPHL